MKKRIFTITLPMLVLGCLMFFTSNSFAQGGADCASAQAITPGTGFMSTVNGPSATNAGAGGSTDASWFSYTPAANGFFDVTACVDATAPDTRLTVHIGDCNNLTLVGFDDDGCPIPPGSFFNFRSVLEDLPAFSGATYYIEWDDRWGDFPTDFDLTFTAGCPAPLSAVVTNPGATTLDVEWLGSASDIEYGPAGFTPGSGTTVTNVTSPYTLTSLDLSTSYDIYVSTNCGGGTVSAAAAFTSGSTMFVCTDPAATAGPTVIFQEDFEGLNCTDAAPGGWTGDFDPTPDCTSGFNAGWIVGHSGNTGSGGVGPNTANTGNQYAYIDGSGAQAGAILNFPGPINLFATIGNAQMEFFWHFVSRGGTAVGASQVDLEITTDNGLNWTILQSFNDGSPAAQADPYNLATIDLNPFVGNVVSMRFVFSADPDFEDFAIDDIVITSCLSCADNAQDPVLNVPDAITLSTTAGICAADIAPGVLVATATDDCPGVAITNDINGSGPDAFGFYPVGQTTINWTAIDDKGNVSTATTIVTIQDLTPPVITIDGLDCANGIPDFVVDLDPGDCDAIVNFSAETTDNCPLTAPATAFETSDLVDGFQGWGGNFSDLTNELSQPIDIQSVDLLMDAGTWDVEIYTTTTSNTFVGVPAGTPGMSDANWTFHGTVNVTSTGVAAPTNIEIPFTMPASTTKGLYITVTQAPIGGGPISYEINFGGTTRTNGDLTMVAGVGVTYPWNVAFGTPGSATNYRRLEARFNYNVDLGPFGFNQTAGLPSGSQFSKGTTVNTFVSTDVLGNSSTCSFNVVVNEFPGPYASLSANDLVQVSLDDDGCGLVTPDDILEGGPYGCYEDFIMTRNPAYTGSCPAPATGYVQVGCEDIGTTITVTVTDPDTGNSVWSTVTIEDKLDPVILSCEDTRVFACDGTVDAVDTPPAPVAASATFAGPSGSFGGGGFPLEVLATADVSGVPPAAVISSVEVEVQLTHTWVSDLTLSVISPSGVEIQLIDGICGAADNIDANFTDQGLAQFCVAAIPTLNGQVMPDDPFSTFNGGAANGTWTLRVVDNFNDATLGGGGGQVDGVTFNVVAQEPFALRPTATDNCGIPSNGFTFTDNLVDGDCSGDAGTILRTWTVTDFHGNSTSCVQTIGLIRPTLIDIAFPGDATFDCGSAEAADGVLDPTQAEGGIPTVGGQPVVGGDLCNLTCEVSEETISQVCEGTTKILRTWQCVDWCAGETRSVAQILKIADETGPAIGSSLEDAAIFRNTPIVEAFVDVYESSAPGSSAHNNCAGNVVIPPAVMCNDLNGDGTVDRPEDVDGDGNLDVFEDLNGNGVLDASVNEDVNGNGFLDIGEDLNGNDILETNLNEDVDFDGNLDVDEDLDGDGKLDLVDEDPDGDGQWDCGDNCSSIVSYTTQIWSIDANQNPIELLGESNTNGAVFNDIELVAPNNQQARYAVRYIAEDACGNDSDLIIIVILEDRIPPVAICDELTEVTVINNNGNSGQTGDGCTAVPAESFDDGSYDNCTEVYFLAAQMPFANFPLAALQFRPTVDFCCSDVGQENVVVLLTLDRVAWENYQLFVSLTGNDALFGALLDGPAYRERYNFCMVEVEVDDKIAPVVTSCPADATILCDVYWDTYESGILAGDYSLLDADFGTAVIFDNCDVNPDANVDNQVNQCGEGAIVRTWSAVDNYGNQSGTCTQKINVLHVSDWVVTFPEDVELDCPSAGVLDTMAIEGQFGEPIIMFETCELIAVSYEDEYFDDVPNACLKVNRNWVVINWCVVGDEVDNEANEMSEFMMWNNNGIPGVGCLNGPDWPEPNCDLDGDGDCDETTFRDSWTCNGTTPVLPDASLAGTDAGPDTDPDLNPWDGYIAYQQTIKIQDTTAPVFTDCGDVQEECIFNGCTMTVEVVFPEATDCNEFSNVEVVIESTTLPNFNASTSRATNVPVGTYTVVFKASDNCGNWEVCEKTIVVEDCKKPTPYCKDGIIVGIMNTNPPMIEVWATDLNDGSFDNCGIECISFSESCDAADQVVTYTCDDIGTQAVQIWVQDINGNWDFCETEIIVQDQMQVCNDDLVVNGNIATEDNDDIANVEVNINSNTTDMTYTTDASGMYEFTGLPVNNDYTVTPAKDINHLNGVTTYDLVQISKHILNIDNLDSPYQMIAADANNSETITTFDLVTIRKLILFIDTEFANNTSWRFIPGSYSFPDATNPWAENFPEVVNLNNVTADQLAQDFVGIKIGDVNNSANANELLGADDRSKEGALTLATNDIEVEAGKTYTVEFTANNFDHLGYQFTMNYEGLEFVEVVEGVANADNFGTALVSENVLTASWHKSKAVKLAKDEMVFALTFKANTTAQLSDLLSINSRYTVAEAYNANGSFQDVNIEFNQSTVVEAGFELYQNTPNPFSESTVIGFNLPEATSATITISDVSGRVLRVIEGDYAKGYNQVDVTRNELPSVGVLYYQLDTDKESATKKMILVD